MTSPEPERRAEVEAERRKRETLGGSYLRQAAEALRASGSAETLYPESRIPGGAARRGLAAHVTLTERLARRNRLELSRNATLFSILAAEAYANQFLGWHLTGRDFDAADKLPTEDKFVLGPRLAIDRPLLPRDQQPMQDVARLLRLRTELVHPKLRTREEYDRRIEDPPDAQKFNPKAASEYIVAVADAVGWLLANCDPPAWDLEIAAVDLERDVFLEFGRQAWAGLPNWDEPPKRDLLQSAVQQLLRRSLPNDDAPLASP